MSNVAPLCPKCQSPVQEKDVICLKCGTSLKSLQGRSRSFKNPAAPQKNTIPVNVPGTPQSLSVLKNLILFLFAFFIFSATAGFAWAYFKNFSALFNISDTLLRQNRLSLCEKFYSGLESLALSENVEEVKFYKQQLQKEKESASDPKDAAVGMRVVDHYVDDMGLHVMLTVKNKTPFQILIHDRCFYLKTEKGLFSAHFPSDRENIGPFKLGSKKSATGGVVFKVLGGLSGDTKNFDGKIVFNDGKKYATSDLRLDLSRSKPQKTDGWALVKTQ